MKGQRGSGAEHHSALILHPGPFLRRSYHGETRVPDAVTGIPVLTMDLGISQKELGRVANLRDREVAIQMTQMVHRGWRHESTGDSWKAATAADLQE